MSLAATRLDCFTLMRAGIAQGYIIGLTLAFIFIYVSLDIISSQLVYLLTKHLLTPGLILDKIKLAPALEHYLYSIVNWEKKGLVYLKTSKPELLSISHHKGLFSLYFITMTGANHRKRNSLCLIGSPFSTGMKWDNYFKSTTRRRRLTTSC